MISSAGTPRLDVKKKFVRTILLYNPIAGHGHLDSWNALFVRFLLEAGWRVVSLSPGAEDLRSRLRTQDLEQHPNLRILDWRTPKRSIFQRIRLKLLRTFKRAIGDAPPSHVRSERAKELEASYLQPQEFAQRVADAIEQLGHSPNFIFNMYMDLYRDDEVGWLPFDETHHLPWAGIRFVPSGVPPPEAYYQLPTLVGMCFLNESVQQDYASHFPQKHFECLPDITDSTLPSYKSAFAENIKHLAAGRKIVFMGGTIGSNKNLSHWFKVINQAKSGDWFFVQIGEVHEQNLSAEDLTAYHHALKIKPDNLFVHAEYLNDEKIFNEVILLSDVLFAVYRNFSLSSNMPGKAAAFNKPILVADGFLMGARVRQYQIGLTVPECDVELTLQALAVLTQPPSHRLIALPEHYAAYRQDFGHEALKTKLFGFLDRACVLTKA